MYCAGMTKRKLDNDWAWAMATIALCAAGCLAPEDTEEFYGVPEVVEGEPFDLPTGPSYITIRPGDPIVLQVPQDDYLAQALREAVLAWERDADGARFEFSETSGLPSRWVSPDDERVDGVAGLAYSLDGYPEQWQLYELLFSRDLRAYQFRSNLAVAARHELGHALGAFGHITEWGWLMSESANYSERIDEPSVRFACAVYGCEVSP